MEFELGKSYKWDEINNFYEEKEHAGDEVGMIEYGDSFVGKNAIHIDYFHYDYWFIMDGANGNGVPSYKCVYIDK